MINWEAESVLNTFVIVPVPVTDFYDTGITAQDVAADSSKATSFAEVRKTIETRLKGKILVGHDAQYHLSSLGLTHPAADTRDCYNFFPDYEKQEEGKEAVKEETASSLESLCKKRLQRSLPPSGHSERPMQSCLAALDLYKKYRKEWEQFLISKARKQREQVDQFSANAAARQPHPSPQPGYAASPRGYPAAPRSRLGSTDTVNSVQSINSVHSVRNDVVAVHCETVQTANDAVAVARVTVMNFMYEVMWDVFVEVHKPVIRSGESSFVPEDLIRANGAVPLSHVKNTMEQMMYGKIVVGYKIGAALQVLGVRISPNQLRDTAYFRPFMYAEMDGVSGAPVVVERSLDELSLEMLQKPLALPCNRSRPLAACSTVLSLYQMHQDRWEQEAFMLQQHGPGHSPPPYGGSNQPSPQFDSAENKSSSSWFGWGKKSQQDAQSAFHPQDQFQPSIGASGSMAPSTALSEQAFQALHGVASPSPSYGHRDGSSYYDGSSQVEPSTLFDGSSHYDRSAHATFDDSSRGIVETFTAPSVVSSHHDDASFGMSEEVAGAVEQSTSQSKSSSWFRFGSKKSRAQSPSTMAVVREREEPSAASLLLPVMDSGTAPDAVVDLNAVVGEASGEVGSSDPPSSRTWFGFRRRSLSPGRMRAPSPGSPESGPTAATSGTDDAYSPTDGSQLITSMDGIEVSLPGAGVDQMVSPLREMTEGVDISQRSGASWFNFRRSKSPKPLSDGAYEERLEPLRGMSDRASDQGDSMVATGKTNGTDDDWLQEVMSQSTGTGDDVHSMGFASLLDAEASITDEKPQKSKKSRGSSWFGFKRSKSGKPSKLGSVSDAAEGTANLKLPGLVSVETAKNNDDEWSKLAAGAPYESAPSHLGVSWYLGVNDTVPTRKSSSSDEGRSRLPTESTVPTVSTEEAEEATENSGKEDFTEEFEKGVAQSFAYLEI
ncbi:MAG: hypothetical protein SGILL_008769 [Bacillariaceae sp.]